jgi:hypothetical protein
VVQQWCVWVAVWLHQLSACGLRWLQVLHVGCGVVARVVAGAAVVAVWLQGGAHACGGVGGSNIEE